MEKNRVVQLFSRKPKNILSVFFTAGFPVLESTTVIAAALDAAGADLIEIGIPFSDPVADGPVIQSSNKVALDNGMTLKKLLGQVREIRNTVALPILLMGYVNPLMQYGFEQFCKDAAAAGVDGLILPDLPMDEFLNEYKVMTDAAGLTNTFLISPTTSADRIRKIDEATRGFIYAVSASSITGARADFSEEQIEYIKRLASLKLKNQWLVGFGISNHRTFSKVCQYCAGAIVGSAFISMLKDSENIPADIRLFVKQLKERDTHQSR